MMVLVFAAWLLSVGRSGVIPVLVAGLSLFSKSLSVELLLLLSLTLYSFVVSIVEGKRNENQIYQKYYYLRMMGCFVALTGHAMPSGMESAWMILVGLLFTLPNILIAIVFKRHFISMTTRAYLYSTALPALMTLHILSHVRNDIKLEIPQSWDILLTVLSIGSLMGCSVLAFFHSRTKALLVFLTQSWIGLGLFLLVPEQSPFSVLAFTALLAFVMTAPRLILLGKQCGKSSQVFYRLVLLGLPGSLGFSVYYYSIKCVAQLHVVWILTVLFAYLFQLFALMMNDKREYVSLESALKTKKTLFVLAVCVQMMGAAGLYWIELMGMK